jgi:mannose-6-phosphate isomerase-like protein (cupin superfamily)
VTVGDAERERLDRAIREVAADGGAATAGEIVRAAGLDALPVLARLLAADAPIEVAERFESILKSVLLEQLGGGVDGPTARRVARFQQQVGFLFKYKSYAIKCATPLGYSVFFQRPGEGFSFQRHVTRKTEVFHVVDVQPGGYAFVCAYDDWVRAYEPRSFAAWLAGTPDTRYDRFRFDVRPGDVFVIDQLNVVHTVIGCSLEEFATVSTDMVDRLHDQNAGRPIPAGYDGAYSRARLDGLRVPDEARLLELGGPAPVATRIDAVPVAGGTRLTLADTFVLARRTVVDPGGTTDVQRDEGRAAVLHVTRGAGRVVVADRDELARPDPPSLPVRKADVLLVAPGIGHAFVNDGAEPLEVSEHRITLEAALA